MDFFCCLPKTLHVQPLASRQQSNKASVEAEKTNLNGFNHSFVLNNTWRPVAGQKQPGSVHMWVKTWLWSGSDRTSCRQTINPTTSVYTLSSSLTCLFLRWVDCELKHSTIVRVCWAAVAQGKSQTGPDVLVRVLWRTWSSWSLKASPSETLLTWSAVVKCDGRAFGAFPGCVTRCFTLTSRFLPPRPAKVTIYATRCRHFLSFFLLFRACKASWDMWGHEGL